MNTLSPAVVARLEGADVRFGTAGRGLTALNDVSLSIHRGERVALIGANGCGKSTLLRLLHGLIEPVQGQVERAAEDRWAMVFQRPYLMRLSVVSNVSLGLWLRGTPWKQARAQGIAALQQVGLADHADRPARKLSGGQQQRVALARAWAMAPQVLLLDEPTSSLDPHAKREVETLVAGLASSAPDVTLVFASHNLGQVKRLASRVIYLESGRVMADLPVNDFFDGDLQSSHPEAHAFIKGETA